MFLSLSLLHHNPDGSRATMTHPTPSGYGTETYHYDAARRLISLINYLNRTSSWTYQDNNWLQQQTLGNGAYTTYTQNALGQLVGMTNYSATATAFSVYSNFAYDGAHNLTALTANVPGLPTFSGTTAYTYDTKNQLLEEQSTCHGGYDNDFGYDDAGNATTFEGLAHTYNTSNQLAGAGYVYDGNGNPTTYQGYTLQFDTENRLITYGGILTMGYNGDGLRAWKQSTFGGKIYYLYDGSTLLCEMDDTGTVTAVNTWGATGLLARNDTWYQFDPQGDVVHRLDANSQVLSNDLYNAYGMLLEGGDPTDPYGYKGQYGYYTDHETGLILCTNRYYDPSTGRWLTRDPISFGGGSICMGIVGMGRWEEWIHSDYL